MRRSELHMFFGQVEGNTGFDSISIFPISEESDIEIKTGDDEHADVEHAGPTFEILGLAHVFLEGKHQRNAFERVDGGAEEQRQSPPGLEGRARRDGRQILQDVIEHDDDAEDLQKVRNDRNGRQQFQIADPVEEYQRNAGDCHKNPRVPAHISKIPNNLL